MYTAEGSAQC